MAGPKLHLQLQLMQRSLRNGDFSFAATTVQKNIQEENMLEWEVKESILGILHVCHIQVFFFQVALNQEPLICCLSTKCNLIYLFRHFCLFFPLELENSKSQTSEST